MAEKRKPTPAKRKLCTQKNIKEVAERNGVTPEDLLAEIKSLKVRIEDLEYNDVIQLLPFFAKQIKGATVDTENNHIVFNGRSFRLGYIKHKKRVAHIYFVSLDDPDFVRVVTSTPMGFLRYEGFNNIPLALPPIYYDLYRKAYQRFIYIMKYKAIKAEQNAKKRKNAKKDSDKLA